MKNLFWLLFSFFPFFFSKKNLKNPPPKTQKVVFLDFDRHLKTKKKFEKSNQNKFFAYHFYVDSKKSHFTPVTVQSGILIFLMSIFPHFPSKLSILSRVVMPLFRIFSWLQCRFNVEIRDQRKKTYSETRFERFL